MAPKQMEFATSATHRPHLVALDSLRGIAALSVVIFHFRFTTPLIAPVFQNAYLMVDLFFVLSGFAIYYAYHDRLQTVAQVRRFIWLRFWRLYPIHFAMLAYFVAIEVLKLVAGAFVTVHHAAFSLGGVGAIAANLLLLQGFNLTNGETFNGPSWSISAEFYTYIVFALIALMVGSRGRLLFASALISICSTLALAIFWPTLDATFDFGWVRALASFFLGVMTFVAYDVLSYRLRAMDLGWVALVALIIYSAFIIFMPAGANIAVIPLSALLILLVALSPQIGVIRILCGWAFRWLGAISYSIYMVHAAVGFALGYAVRVITPGHLLPLQEACVGTANIVAVILLGSATYRWIETPFRDWSRT